MLHFLSKSGELPGLYDHVLYTLFVKVNVNPVFLHFKLNFNICYFNNFNICNFNNFMKLLHTKHYTLNFLMAPTVGERELSGISDTACYPFIPPCIICVHNQYNQNWQPVNCNTAPIR